MFVSLFFVGVPIQFYQKRKSTYFPKDKLKDSAYFSGFGKKCKRYYHGSVLHYRAKLCQAKFSLQNEKFVTFARRIICPIKVKVSLVEVQVNLRGVQVIQTIVTISLGETLPGEIFITFKNSSL